MAGRTVTWSFLSTLSKGDAPTSSSFTRLPHLPDWRQSLSVEALTDHLDGGLMRQHLLRAPAGVDRTHCSNESVIDCQK